MRRQRVGGDRLLPAHVRGAKETIRMAGPGDSIMHAEIEIGDSKIGLSIRSRKELTKPPNELGGTSVSILVYVEDTDALYKQAIDAGATSLREPTDMFWGDRFGSSPGSVRPSWTIATHIEDVSPEEMETRSQQWQEQMAGMASQQA